MSGSNTESVYREHHQWLLSWIMSKVGCDQRAADLMQDTFVRLMLNQQKQKGSLMLEQPRAYLRTLANGLVIDHYRRRSLEQAYWEVLNALPEQSAISEEDKHLILETLDQVDQVLESLPARARQAFLMSQIDDLSYKQIAKQMGVSERTIKRDMQLAFVHCLSLMQ
ncbi:sigma-70 family RNA polymerase sigma factor [Methylophaga lonarensis]|uniref:sigma-70 family RNA polymerase sigma factor n=1 Tax=Methylophaga lonarensis TaxID=999151 RepID=UPI003D2AD89D